MYRAEVEWLRGDGEWILAEAVRIAQATMAGAPGPITTEMTFELITPALLDRSAQVWMLVVGSRGRGGISRTVVGSLSSAVAAYARCPVTVVSDLSATDPLSRRKPVLVGVDGSPDSEEALEVAFAEASYRGVGLVAVRSWSDTSGIALASRYWIRRAVRRKRCSASIRPAGHSGFRT
ncbi:universal stress protein [Nocardia brevicatena]|uniref:universal stress protein n=1 Tax=Nocardia brevicatena TaxID=37327 RepID=UPI0002D544D3|nr:universal stress protein [Nocardia brevicatena]